MEVKRDEKGRILPGYTGNPNGRPKKKTFRDYFNEEEEKDLIIKVKQALAERPEILKMAVEQIFGKPKQQMELSGDIEKPIPILNVQQNNGNKSNNEPGQEDSGNLRRDISEQDSINPPIFDSPGTER